MSAIDKNRLDELRTVVIQLGRALSVSERRTARLEMFFRWSVITTVLAVGMVLIVALQPLGYAVAGRGDTPSKTVEQAIDRLSENLTGHTSTLGQMGMMLSSMMDIVVRRAKSETAQMPKSLTESDCGVATESNPGLAVSKDDTDQAVKDARTAYPLGYYTKCYFLTNDIIPVDGIYQDEQYQKAILSALGGAVVEMGVLVYRIRHDSDFIQRFETQLQNLTAEDALAGITQQLETLNVALASVPQMTRNMNMMTQQMGVMTNDMTAMTHNMANMNYSMGSTMGRMGSWMPW